MADKPLEWEDVVSSNLAAVAYDAAQQRLWIRFNSGGVGVVADVPKEAWRRGNQRQTCHYAGDWVMACNKKDPRYLFSAGTTAICPPPEPCIHLGSPTRGDLSPDRVRNWHGCDHPEQPLGAVVCSCKGCGPKCPGFKS